MSYPTDLAGRQVRRAHIRARFIAEAEHRARFAGRSLACGSGLCPPSCVGAVGCLCECHDPRETA